MRPDNPIANASVSTTATGATTLYCCSVEPLPGCQNTYAVTIPYALGNGDVLAGFFEIDHKGRVLAQPFPGGYSREAIAEIANAGEFRYLNASEWEATHGTS